MNVINYSLFSHRQLQPNLDSIDDMPEEEGALVESSSLSSSHSDWKNLGNFLRISLDNNQSTVIPLHNEMTILEVVENTCSKRQLNPEAYYLKLGLEDDSGVTGKGKNWFSENVINIIFCSQLRNFPKSKVVKVKLRQRIRKAVKCASLLVIDLND